MEIETSTDITNVVNTNLLDFPIPTSPISISPTFSTLIPPPPEKFPPTPAMIMRTRSMNSAALIGRPWTAREEIKWEHRLERERLAFERTREKEIVKNKQGWFGTSTSTTEETRYAIIRSP